MNRQKTLPIIILIAALLLVSFVSVSTALNLTAPTVTSFTPGNGVNLYSSNVNISFKVTDLDDNIQNSNYFIKVNGNTISSSLKYKGHASGSQWIIDSYLEATISGSATGLSDGVQRVEVQAMDQAGNLVTKSWTFNVASKPVFSNPSPANASSTGNNTSFSVKVTDNGQINPTTIKLAFDSTTNYVVHTYNQTTGEISYTTATPIPDGKHTIYASAKDMAGNAASYSWSYTVLATGPALTYADAGKAFTIPNPGILIGVKALSALETGSILIDGQPINSTFTYKGHWTYPNESETGVWVVDNYNEATITAQAADLADGTHVVTASAIDKNGNSKTSEWNIIIKAIPTFSAPSPVNGAYTTENKGFSLQVADNEPLDPAKIVVKLDGAPVTTTYDAVTGIVAYQPPTVIPDGYHKVNVSVTDARGNTAVFNWSFTCQTVGPDLTFADAGKAIDTYKPNLSVSLKSNAKILDTDFMMLLDNQQVPANFAYKGTWESAAYQDPSWVTNYGEATISFVPGGLEDGPHTLSVTAKDELGNISTMTWNFTIAQKPLFTGIEPADGITTTNNSPTIKTEISDPNSPELDLAKIKLLLDNKAVTPTLTVTDGKIYLAYATGSLNNDTYHNVSLSATDAAGNTNTAIWKFYINTKGEMPVSTNDCGSCHTLNQFTKYEHVTKGPYNFDKATFFHGTGNNCKHCHTGYTEQFCGYCHNGDASDIALGTATPDPSIGAGKECLSCHSPTPNAIGPATASNAGVIHQINTGIEPLSLNPENVVTHDILPLHNVDNPSCVKCHSSYLTREHNRVSKAGVQLDCSTCHNSTKPEVKAAVTYKDTNCSACHTSAGHQAQHASTLDANCQTCHSTTLIDEHLNNQKTTGGKNFDCDTCHANTGTAVKRSIANHNRSCTGCHTQAHNISLVDTIPADIPLYDVFQWSSALEASIFAGDPATPNGYAAGQLVLSNRKADVTTPQVWNYYQEQLAAKGWTAGSGAPATGASYFATEFQKDGRFLLVRCYNTVLGDGTGGNSSGYRVDLWYK